MKLLQYITLAANTLSVFSIATYNFIKYKLNLSTSSNAVISVCNSLIHKNYLFTKVVQWGVQEVYDGANIKGKENDELKSYFSIFSNSVPYMQYELHASLSSIKNVIDFANSRNDELVIENDNIPTNSGSVALIFKAKLNGKPIVIKVLRPHIKKRIQMDIDSTLYFFNNVVIKHIIGYYIKLNFKTFIEHNSESLLNQCDFISEVNNAILFKDKIKNKKNILIPHVYKHFTEAYDEVIVMEYLDGPVAKNVPLEEIKKHCKMLQTFFIESLFRYNLLHGDFHLGNIIMVSDTTIGVIDFGIVFNLTDELSNTLFDIVFMVISLNTGNDSDDNKIFCKLMKTCIRIVCSDERQHKCIYENIKNDKELLDATRAKFSANLLIIIINKIMTLQNVDLKPNMCQLILTTMSGLHTIEYVNDNMSLQCIMHSFINRSIKI